MHIKLMRMRLLGRNIRLEIPRKVQTVYIGAVEGRISRGRSRLRWKDRVRMVLDNSRIKKWRKRMGNKESWKKTMKEVKARI